MTAQPDVRPVAAAPPRLAVVGFLLISVAVALLDTTLTTADRLSPSLVRGEYDWQSIISGLSATIFGWLLAILIVFRGRRLV